MQDQGKQDNGEDGDPQVTRTVIDVLSGDVEFSSFLRAIQQIGMVPYLNALENITLLAPINSAFVIEDGFDSLSMKLENDIKRYILDSYITTDDIKLKGTLISKTFKNKKQYPILSFYDYDYETVFFEDSEVVEPDLFATSQNSIVHGISSLYKEHDNICNQLMNNLNSSKTILIFQKLIKDKETCGKLTNVTGFIPLDAAITFNEIELNYLTFSSIISETDRLKYINGHFTNGYVGGNVSDSQPLSLGTTLTSTSTSTSNCNSNVMVVADLNNNLHNITSQNHGHTVLIDELYKSNISNVLASDGILHFFQNDSFMVDPIVFTPRKYLLGLNNSIFVEELDFKHLNYLIDDNELEQTLFVTSSSSDEDFASISDSHKDGDLYQFVQGKIDLNSSKLVDSKLCYKKLGDNCQKIKITKLNEKILLNNHVYINEDIPKIEVGNTYIYLMDDNLTPPPRLDVATGPYFSCSKSMSYLDELGLIILPNNKKGYTLFLPCHEAWENLELTWEYLTQNKTALAILMENNIIEDLIYSDFTGEITSTTLTGDPIVISSNSSTPDDKNQLMSLNGTEFQIVKNSDILFNQGVVHVLEDVIFPKSLDITLQNLVETTKSFEFLKFLDLFNLSNEVFDNGYSLILPTPRSLLLENITLFTDPEFMSEFLRLHILPSTSVESLLNCESKIPTLLNNSNLSCRELSTGNYMLQIAEGKDKEVRILSKGCTSKTYYDGDVKSCIFLIDRPISPDWLNQPSSSIPHIKLPGVAMGIGALLGILIIFFVTSCFLIFFLGRNKSFESEILDERRGLLITDENDEDNNNTDTDTDGYGSIRIFRGNQYNEGTQGTQGAQATKTSKATKASTSNITNKSNQLHNSHGSSAVPDFSETNYSKNASSKPISVSTGIPGGNSGDSVGSDNFGHSFNPNHNSITDNNHNNNETAGRSIKKTNNNNNNDSFW
ncbi:hypothetical protein PACTADRAFT_51387 [Pachysolen tannophilus NRRL Y-2460]|uniref:FAS1 domain-containing protein n=1 Tax=Pachysolen tannophilus NRRL Y-2460 TaxID=669874 RepID=A0A1E4TPE1_PACTA|nr:hypothetical protein PACTADRAFT_51387 [Pachysolen tannophilus NRRL Y-2460]